MMNKFLVTIYFAKLSRLCDSLRICLLSVAFLFDHMVPSVGAMEAAAQRMNSRQKSGIPYYIANHL